MSDFAPDTLSAPPDAPVVKWMERPPVSVGPAVMAGGLAGAFLLGVLVTAGAVIALRRLEAED